MQSVTRRYLLIISLVGLGALTRLIPHPPNFTSVAAVALFAGAQLGERKYLSYLIPLVAMLIGDAFLGFHTQIPVVYLSLIAIVWLGRILGDSRSVLKLGGATLTSAVLFFAVSNFGVWLFDGMYPITASGLMACYVAAIPFFGNFALGTIAYSALLWGLLSLGEVTFPSLLLKRAHH